MRWLVVLLCLGCALPVWADITVIYRKADRVVCGWAIPPQSASVEVDNCAKSELGGVASDYATVSVTDSAWSAKKDLKVSVNPGGQVVFVPDPQVEDRKTARNSAKQKLKTGQPLTDKEISALVGD